MADFLSRLAADRAAPRVVLEARGDAEGIRHLLGCRPTDVRILGRLLADFIPGSVLTNPGTDQQPARPDVDVACRLRMHPRSLPLRSDTAETTTRAVLSALAAAAHPGETVVVQVVLGPRHAPHLVPTQVPAPDVSLLEMLTMGVRWADSEIRGRLKERFSQGRFGATIRLGTASPDRDRRQRFLIGLLSAISTAQAPGVHIHLVRQPAAALNAARLPWYWPLRLGASELAGLLGWPLGDQELPGLPPIHPKPLRAGSAVHTGPRVFAASAAPGDDRLIGIAPADQMLHAASYGPSGAGKTTVALHLIRADIEAGRPVAVLDPKKQLIDAILGLIPADRMNDVVILDASDDTPVRFNPLDVAGRDPDVVVDGILAVFEAVFSDGWGPRSADIFSASLRTLARASTPQRPATLLDLPKLLTDPVFRRQQVGRVSGDVGLDGFWAWYHSQTPAAQAAAIAPPMNKLRALLLRPALIRMLDQRQGTFRLRDIFRDNRIVLLPLNEGLIGPGTASLLGSLAIADLWQAAQERSDEPGASTRPGMIFIDEAPRFLHLPVSLADALAVSRSLSVGWFLAAQFRSQFPPHLRAAVDMNARSKIVFGTEYDDARDTARLTRDLATEDFLALPKFHAYVNLVADGHPSGWALVSTLPPPRAITDPERVRAVARANYAHPMADQATPDASAAEGAADANEAGVAPSAPAAPIGRKRRGR
ncbi:MAG: type IV secretory system conjugative DNA transfer family protein [Sciscionella sp.]